MCCHALEGSFQADTNCLHSISSGLAQLTAATTYRHNYVTQAQAATLNNEQQVHVVFRNISNLEDDCHRFVAQQRPTKMKTDVGSRNH